MALGPELVQEGTFNNGGAAWTVPLEPATVQFAPGVVNLFPYNSVTHSAAIAQTPEQSSAVLVYGKKYHIEIDIAYTPGGIPIQFDIAGNEVINQIGIVGTVIVEAVMIQTDEYDYNWYIDTIGTGTDAMQLSRISVREVLADAGGSMGDLPDEMWSW